MKNVLILHGAANDSQGNWFPWLKSEMKTLGYKTWAPDLPNPDIPILKDWLNTIFSNKEWVFNEESVIVGHSAGATFILRILEKLPKNIKINKAILVAGPISLGGLEFTHPYKKEMVSAPFSWGKIKASSDRFYFVHSDNDPYECGREHGEIMKEKLSGQLIVLSGQGHFNLEQGDHYRQFPLLLDIIKE